MSHAPPNVEPVAPSWTDVFRGRAGVYTLLLNIGILFFAVDNFLINTLMPSIVADIGGVAFYAWAMMLYLVGSITGAASYGPLRARIGGRRAYAVGGAVFALGALGCSVATVIGGLLVARLFQGVGGGMILAGSMAFISVLFEPRLRKYAVAVSNATWIFAAVVGPLQAGFFANFGWWRGAFFVYVPIGAAFLIGVLWKIPKSADEATADSRALPFPVWRVGLLALGVLCVSSSGLVETAALRIALILAAGLLVWIAFTRDATAGNRLFPSQPLSFSSPVGLAYWGHMLISASYISVSIYLPLVLTVLHGIAPLYVGLANGLMSIGWSIAAALVTGLHGTRERAVVIAGPLCLMAGSVGLAVVAVTGASFAWVMACAPLVGVGIGIFHVHMTVRVMGVARPGEESITASSLTTIRSLGMAFGAAVAGTVGNVAGLQLLATPDIVSTAVTWVYLFNVLPMMLAAAAAVRFFKVTESAPPQVVR
ncbi:MAG: MFS transporter [Alphaproteobacteria bacterium]|nr:MFS transporter [Alphaproteobacteria bacterium]